MEDLFDTITQTAVQKRGKKKRVERDLDGMILRDQLGGAHSESSWYDLDHAMASGDSFSFEPGPLEIENLETSQDEGD
jgi:hypothetical protein